MKRNLVTAEELATLAKINDDCIRMHVCPPPVTFVDMEVKDANGNLVDGFTMKSNSWVRNAYNFAAFLLMHASTDTTYGAGYLGIKKTGGANDNNYVVKALVSNGNDNIRVGTSLTAESFEHYFLQAPIANGNASGQLTHQPGTMGQSYDSGTKKWATTQVRVFNNNSGAGITVNEVGLLDRPLSDESSFAAMVSRDVLASPVTVPNAGQLTVTYTIEMTFPA